MHDSAERPAVASKPLIVHRLADREAADATDHYGGIDPRLSVRFIDELAAALADVAGDRRRWLDTFPYAVVYRDTAAVWLVLAVAHGKRRPGYWRRRASRP